MSDVLSGVPITGVQLMPDQRSAERQFGVSVSVLPDLAGALKCVKTEDSFLTR